MNQREAFEKSIQHNELAIRLRYCHYNSEYDGYYENSKPECTEPDVNSAYTRFCDGWQAATEQGAGEPVAWDDPAIDPIVSKLYRKFKEWSSRGFTADDVTWCEVRGYVSGLINANPPKPIGIGVPDGMIEFAQRCLQDSREGRDCDRTDIYAWALECGLIEHYLATEPCDRGPECDCAAISGFPSWCQRDSALLATQQPLKAITKEESDLLVWARWAASIGINDKGIKSSWQFEQLQNAIQSMTATQQPPERG